MLHFKEFVFAKPMRPVDTVWVHCSASDNPDHDNVATMDAWHKERGWFGCGYHFFIRKDGTIELGRSLEKTPAAQGGHNRGAIAICLHGLAPENFTPAQIEALRDLCRQIDDAYRGEMTFHGHCEVAAKECPVIDYKAVLELDDKGNLGGNVAAAGSQMIDLGDLSALEEPEALGLRSVTLRLGSQGRFVRQLQTDLKELGYHCGAIDGHFGPMTRDAVIAFQAENYLVEDGIAGQATFEALADPDTAPRVVSQERKSANVVTLAANGSRIAQGSVAQTALGGTLTATGAVAALEETTGLMTQVTRNFDALKAALSGLGPVFEIALVVIGVLVILQALKISRARIEDHQTGRTI
ncbi:MAG: peptidoglycan-binding domain-containing protein [Marinovum sp.]|nr:peptidoglycan-binding domain-containing protein [Marinovum sp.]